jgi:hypothetical protein
MATTAGRIQSYLLPRRHTALLVALLFVFVARPVVGESAIAMPVFSVALMTLLLVSLYNVELDARQMTAIGPRRITWIGWLLAVPAVIERLAVIAFPSRWLSVSGLTLWLFVIGFVTWTQVRTLLKEMAVTRETISLAISVYLLLAVAWGLFFMLLYELQPNSFNLGSQTIVSSRLYFSLTTLATVGYGDILPLTLQARYAAVAEGITGQFYLAILVARLVALQTGAVSAPGTPKE